MNSIQPPSWRKYRLFLSILFSVGYLIFYPLTHQEFGSFANFVATVPMLFISINYGMLVGSIGGIFFSLYITLVRYLNGDPNLVLLNAVFIAGIAGFTNALFGLLSDQRRALRASEWQLEQRVIEQTQQLSQLVEELEQAYDTTLVGWSKALELKDKETEGHSQRVTQLALELSQHLGLSPEDQLQIRFGALLHDIGKMGIPDEILQKPGALTLEERIIINEHPVLAHELLKDIAFLEKALTIPCYHHERWNGKGYPEGLQGEGIPLYARIFAVVDVWDALTTDRPYRKAYSKDDALQIMQDENGQHFDPEILISFLELVNNKK